MGDGCTEENWLRYLIVRPKRAGIVDLTKFLIWANGGSGSRFLQTSNQALLLTKLETGSVKGDHRWVIVVSVVMRKMIALFAVPMRWLGYLVEFLMNLLSLNGGIIGLILRFLQGNVAVPIRDTDTFISTSGYLDGRIDLLKNNKSWIEEASALMDLTVMASKLAYENAKVVKNVVVNNWKMQFVGFYDCWNDFQKQNSTQVFISCEDANLILISFRGTEPFNSDDWATDFDYSWYQIPKVGRVHMGFMEAMGLGNRKDIASFEQQLWSSLNNNNSNSDDDTTATTYMGEKGAFYTVRNKLSELLTEHKNAKFVVTGHSLGGALAILFPTLLLIREETEMLSRLHAVYTFGQPRIGDEKLGRYVEAYLNHHHHHQSYKYLRVVYCNDIVPRLPYDDKTFLYKHFGVCLYYNSFYKEQEVEEEPNRNYFGIMFMVPQYLTSVWELVRAFLMGYLYGQEYEEGWFSICLRMVGLFLPGLADHSLRNYVNSVRLGRRRRRRLFASPRVTEEMTTIR